MINTPVPFLLRVCFARSARCIARRLYPLRATISEFILTWIHHVLIIRNDDHRYSFLGCGRLALKPIPPSWLRLYLPFSFLKVVIEVDDTLQPF